MIGAITTSSQILGADQRVIKALVVGVVQDQPKTGQQKGYDLQHQRRIAELVDGQGADGAHCAHEQVADAVGGVDEQEQRNQLKGE